MKVKFFEYFQTKAEWYFKSYPKLDMIDRGSVRKIRKIVLYTVVGAIAKYNKYSWGANFSALQEERNHSLSVKHILSQSHILKKFKWFCLNRQETTLSSQWTSNGHMD